MVLSGVPDALVAGSAATLTVVIHDSAGDVATGYRGTLKFQSTDPAAVVPAPYTFTAADRGRHSFPDMVVLKTAGPRTVEASDSADPALAASLTVTVAAGTASELRLAGIAAQVLAGSAQSTTVGVYDSYGNVADGYGGIVSFVSTDPHASVPAAYAFTAADRGTHTFSGGVLLRTAGTQTVTAAAGGGPIAPVVKSVAVLSQSAPSGSQTVTVLPAAASTLAIAGLSASVPAGTASSATVTVLDPFGNVATGYRGTVHFTCTDASAALPPDHTFTAADAGVFAFGAQIVLRTAGTQTTTVTDTVTASIGGSVQVVVLPSAAATLGVGTVTSATAGSPIAVTVTAYDAAGNVATAYTGTVSIASDDAHAVLPQAHAFSAADGGAFTFAVDLRTAGTRTVSAADLEGKSASASVAVAAGQASTLAVSGHPSPTTAGTSNPFTVTARDDFGNVATSYGGTVRFAASDRAATLPADAALSGGTGTFAATLRTSGTQSITAADVSAPGISGAQAGISVLPAAAASLSVAGYPASAAAGTSAAVRVAALDSFGNVASGYTGTIRLGSSDPQALLPAPAAVVSGAGSFTIALRTAGTQSISAADVVAASLAGAQTGISISAAPASVLDVHGFPTAVTAGIAAPVAITARDPYGNLDASFNDLVHFSSDDSAAALPADAPLSAGTGSFQVELRTAGIRSIATSSGTISGGQGGIAVSAAAAATLDVTGLPAQVVAGQAYDFTVTAHDAFANVATGFLAAVHFTSTDPNPAAVLPPDYTFTPGDAGRHLFAGGATFATAGQQTLTATAVGAIPAQIDVAASVLQYHRSRTRDGLFVQPALTRAAAAGLHRDATFPATVTGKVYAQPLFVAQAAPSPDLVITATNENEVTAFDAGTGAIVWRRLLGTPVPLSALPCGNIDPLGIVGTPIVDVASRTVFLDAMTTGDGGATMEHQIFGLSVDDGSTRAGWPLDVGANARSGSLAFNARFQNQRGALSLVDGVLYVPYGGHFGDCGDYHGWLVGIEVSTRSVNAWATSATGGAIWAPNGTSSDGSSVFAATGNTFGATTWGGGESVLRFSRGPSWSGADADRFTPPDWQALDNGDVDIGSSGPILVDLPQRPLAVQMGKNGTVYLLDRANLGGLTTALYGANITSSEIINGPAAVTDAAGTSIFLATEGGPAEGCAVPFGSFTALRLMPGPPPVFTFSWCAHPSGQGSPIVTTTDGSSDAIAWIVGAEGDQRLHGYDADTGREIYPGTAPGDSMPALVQHFDTLIAARGRLYVGANGQLYVFRP